MGFYNNSDVSSFANGLSYVPRYKSHELSKRPGEIVVGFVYLLFMTRTI